MGLPPAGPSATQVRTEKGALPIVGTIHTNPGFAVENVQQLTRNAVSRLRNLG